MFFLRPSGVALLWALGLPHVVLAADPAPRAFELTQSQRLSAWLATHPEVASPNAPGTLQWDVARMHSRQSADRDALADRLRARHSALAGLVRGAPLTGRVALPSSDGRWLEANPGQDPILSPGDRLSLYPPDQTVTVVQADGYLCVLPHQAGAAWTRYVEACGQAVPAQAWVVQADGSIQVAAARSRFAEMVAPVPGAWLWAPSTNEGIDEATSASMAAFLGTLPPASAIDYAWRRSAHLSGTAAPVWSQPLPHVSTTDWGAVGLLQTPTARMEASGTAGLMLGRTIPYSHIKARLQPFDWLSISFGYVSMSDRLYGTQALSGDQSYKDKSLDVKVRLWQETALRPEMAVGWHDLLGTGIFASEYLVANKAFGPVDLSAGLAFGYLGGRGNVHNPLSWLSPKFNERPAPGSVSGGLFNTRTYFRGPAALFGGVSYQFPNRDWQLKLEYDGNDYHQQTGKTPLRQDSPLNIGVVYRYGPSMDLTVGYERGNQVMFGLMLHSRLDRLNTPKLLDPKPVPVRIEPATAPPPPAQTVQAVEQQIGAPVVAMRAAGPRWSFVLDHADTGFQGPLIDKVAAVAHRDAPAQVKTFDVTLQNEGVDVATVHVDRDQWVQQRTQYVIPAERRDPVTVTPATPPAASDQLLYNRDQAGRGSPWSTGASLSYTQTLGGPDGFLLFNLATDLDLDFRLNADTWLSSRARVRLIDNYGKFKYTAPSRLPRVRTYIREYLTSSRVTVPNLQLTHMDRAGDNHFFLAYAGLLETMYAGAGAEYLYRPVHSPWALGVDANRVYQRGFEQRLALRDYKVSTGHATLYWDTGFQDMLLKLSAGRYLAGDVGVTVDASRRFANGVKFGAYATKTNVSARDFGEGSFDKGIYVTIPFDVMLPRTGGGEAYIDYAPLLRDGGAKLNRRYTLFDLTRSRDPRALEGPGADD